MAGGGSLEEIAIDCRLKKFVTIDELAAIKQELPFK